MAGLQRIDLYLCLLPFALFSVPAAAEPAFAGSAACRTCHPNIVVNYFRNPHFKTQTIVGRPPEASGCEGCHGPGSEHIAARGDKTKIIAFSLIQPKQVLDNCLRCHAESLGRAQVRRSQHSLAQVACNGCHSIHRPVTPKYLLGKEQRDVCYGCHANVRAQFSQPSKHRVNEGFMNCTDCHNPHGAQAPNWAMGARPRMVDAALGNEEPCLKCHVDKRGPFAYEHPATRVDGCGACHTPHGSAHARLLKRPAVFTLCLECHNGLANFGSQGDGVRSTPPNHNMADPRFRNCTVCHARIHGSNASEKFLR
jgi:DmsE family decaheme c-type cytochrome